jgi:outer membrane protein OmpA-like peptidoglycan-associated protein
LGDFPLQWNTNSSGEIVTLSKLAGRWFKMSSGGFYIPEAKEPFTENFTVEFDLYSTNTANTEYLYNTDFIFVSGTLADPNEGGAIPGKAGMSITANNDAMDWSNWAESAEGYKDRGNASMGLKSGEKYHISFWVQKQRIRMYVDENKVLDLPRGLIEGYVYNIFRMQTSEEITLFISNFRIAAGLPDMRNKLLTEGKLVSYGILFDVNSDILKPESFATIKEIAQVLKDNPAIKLKIVGHTDSDGEEAFNMDLSKRRAASVKLELTKKWSIDATRITTDGKGESVPLVPNDSGIHKARNRRVEFIKQ